MPDPTARELKLIQYLNEAYGKEKQLETTLQAQIQIIQNPRSTSGSRSTCARRRHRAGSREAAQGARRQGHHARTCRPTSPTPQAPRWPSSPTAAPGGHPCRLRGTGAADPLRRRASSGVAESCSASTCSATRRRSSSPGLPAAGRADASRSRRRPGKDVIKEESPPRPQAGRRLGSRSRASSSRSSSRSDHAQVVLVVLGPRRIRVRRRRAARRRRRSPRRPRASQDDHALVGLRARSSRAATARKAPKPATRAKTTRLVERPLGLGVLGPQDDGEVLVVAFALLEELAPAAPPPPTRRRRRPGAARRAAPRAGGACPRRRGTRRRAARA